MPSITWISDGVEAPATASLHPLGKLSPSAPPTKCTISFPSPSIPADCAIEITAHYHLVSDPDTPIHKSVMAEMPIVNPFSTAFDFSPRVHPDPWPDYFSLEEGTGWENGKRVLGITQRWCLTVTLSTTGGGAVVAENWELPIHAVESGGEGAVCRVILDENPKESLRITFPLLPLFLHFRFCFPLNANAIASL